MTRGIIFDFNRTLYNPENGKLMQGARKILEELRDKYKLGLVSFGEEERNAQILELGLNDYFSYITVVREKTTQTLLEFCNRFGLKPEEVVIIGDRVKSEVTLGNSLGMTTVWLKSGKFSGEVPSGKTEEPDFTIENLEAIEEIITKIGDNK